MKGKLLLIVIFLLSNVTFAQSVGTYKAKKAETVKEKVVKPKKVKPEKIKPEKIKPEINAKRRGFFIMPEIGVEALAGDGGSFVGLVMDCIIGYEFNNYFAVGVGYGCSLEDGLVGGIVPVVLSGDLTNKSIFKTKKGKETTPYYSLKMHWYMKDEFCGFYKRAHNFYISPEFGIRINRSRIGVGLLFKDKNLGGYKTSGYKVGVSLKYSYNIGL